MPVEQLSPGRSYNILQNVVYALPAVVVRVQSLVAIEASIDNSTWAALTGANTTGVETSAQFIRCTTGDTVVSIKRL